MIAEDMARKITKKIAAAHDDSIGHRIAIGRKAKGLTQIELAEQLDVTQGLLSQYELGRTKMTAEMLLRIARILGVSSDEILGLKAAKASVQIQSRNIARRMASLNNLPRRKQAAILQTIDLALSGAER